MEPEITISPVTVGSETRVIIVKPTFTFFTLPAPAAAPKPESKRPESFDLDGAAEFLGRSRPWLRDNCTSLGIGHERVGRGFRFTLHELERYLALAPAPSKCPVNVGEANHPMASLLPRRTGARRQGVLAILPS
jgi:hypothetical protein